MPCTGLEIATRIFGFFVLFVLFLLISRRYATAAASKAATEVRKPTKTPPTIADHKGGPSVATRFFRSRRHRDSHVAVVSSLAFRRRMSKPRGRMRTQQQQTRPKSDERVVPKSTCCSLTLIRSKDGEIMVIYHHHSTSLSHRLCRREAARRLSLCSAATAITRAPSHAFASARSPLNNSRSGARHAETFVGLAIDGRKHTGGQFRREGQLDMGLVDR